VTSKVGEGSRFPRRQTAGSKLHPRIGILASDLVDEYQAAVIEGARDSALLAGLNLRCFVGGELGSEATNEAQRNRLYDLVGRENVDALVVMAGAIGNHWPKETLVEFCARFAGLPMCTISGDLPGVPTIIADNRPGVRDAVSHLVRIHNRRRIGFICGPDANQDAQERYGAYVDALAEHQLGLDPRFVVPGDFSFESGESAIRSLFDERKLLPEDIDAIVAADDSTALGALSELAKRKIVVPRQIAIIGFDDVEQSRFSSPPLSTVRQPLRELGAEAVRMLHARLQGAREREGRTILPTHGVFRRSCGCYGGDAPAGSRIRAASSPVSFEAELVSRRSSIRAELMRASAGSFGVTPDWEDRLITTFAEQLRTGSDRFSSGFATFVDTLVASGIDVAAVHVVITVLRRQMLACLVRDHDMSTRAEDIFQEARIMASEAAERAQARRRARVEQAASALSVTSRHLLTVSTLSALAFVLHEHLPALGIAACHVSVFVKASPSATEARLVVSHDATQPPDHHPTETPFLIRLLAPRECIESNQALAHVVTLLHFSDQSIGIVVMTYGSTSPHVYETLADMIGAALHRSGVNG
jgi:sigma-B regulation protein RsbU (phosphoserine phosphatase)